MIEALPDGSFIVAIEGFGEYRAINAEKAREIQKLRVDFDAAQKTNAELATQIKEALLQRDLAQAQKAVVQQKSDSFEKDFNRAKEDVTRFQGLFMSERELRQEAQSFVPRGNATGKFAKFLDFLNSQPVQMTFKVGIPIFQTLRCQ